MKKNTAILNTITKLINFNFNGEEFEVDLKEGDLEDSWNAIITKDEEVFDVNFTWEEVEPKDEKIYGKPYFTVYGLSDNGDGTWSTDTNNSTSIKIVEIIGDKNQYYYDKPYEFNYKLLTRFEVFDGNGVLQLKTKRLNKASDECVTQHFRGNLGWYCIAIDSNNARKNIS